MSSYTYRATSFLLVAILYSIFWIRHNLTSSLLIEIWAVWGFFNYQLFCAVVRMHVSLHPPQLGASSSILVFALMCEENGILLLVCVSLIMNEI